MKNPIDDPKEDVQEQTSAGENESSFTTEVEDKEVAFVSEKNSSFSNSNGQGRVTGSDQASSKG